MREREDDLNRNILRFKLNLSISLCRGKTIKANGKISLGMLLT